MKRMLCRQKGAFRSIGLVRLPRAAPIIFATIVQASPSVPDLALYFWVDTVLLLPTLMFPCIRVNLGVIFASMPAIHICQPPHSGQ